MAFAEADMRSHTNCVLLLTGLFLVGAHAASPKPSGFLQDYEVLYEGEYLEAYWIDMPRIERDDSPAILLGSVSVDHIKDHKHIRVEDCVAWLQTDLLQSDVVSEEADAKYRLDLAISYMTPGSAAKRIWAGEFGAGHAILQIEGKVVEVDGEAIVATFAERRRSSGAIGVEDLAGDSGPRIIEHMTSQISEDIVSELRASFTVRR